MSTGVKRFITRNYGTGSIKDKIAILDKNWRIVSLIHSPMKSVKDISKLKKTEQNEYLVPAIIFIVFGVVWGTLMMASLH